MALGMCLAAARLRAQLGLAHTVWPRAAWAAWAVRGFATGRPVGAANEEALSRVRNLGIIAHIDAGKTTTTERMLHYAGFTRRIGDVDDGDTVMDYLPAERERGITIQSAAITFGWRGAQLHLIDTPGHVDFTMEVERAVRVLDGAVTILDAVAGVQAQTQTVWKQAARYGIPRLVFINKMDREGASWRKCVDDVVTKLNATPLVLQVPEAQKSRQGQFTASELGVWLDAVTLERITFDILVDSSGASVRRQKLSREADPQAFESAAQARAELVEALAEVDGRIMDVFLSDGVDGDHLRVPEHEVRAAVRRATLATLACPVLLGASYRNIGVQPLLDAIVDYLPSPADRPLPQALVAGATPKAVSKTARTEGPQTVQVYLDPSERLVAFAFKVIADPQRGPMVFVRVYSGTLDVRMVLVNGTQGGVKERATKLLQMYADLPEEIESIGCGHIGVVLGLKQTKTGDTLLHPQHPSLVKAHKSTKKPKPTTQAVLGSQADAEPVGLQLHGVRVPPPVFFCAVEADSPQDEKPLAEALSSLLLEDPSLRIAYDPETGQTLLSGMGELHLEIIRDRLLSDMKIRASFGTMRVSYREMAGDTASADHMYAKEVAGKIGKAAMRVTVAPIESQADVHGQAHGSAESMAAPDSNAIEVEMPESLVAADGAAATVAAGRDDAGDGELCEMVRSAIEAGVRNALFRGAILGFPVARTLVRVADVQYFGEEISMPAAYRACAAQALFKALGACRPVLLEPIAKVAIQCPEASVGPVLSDLNGARRGRVLSLDDAESKALDGAMVLVAEAPLSAMVGYSSALRSLTAGAATFSLEVVGFGAMTAQQQQKIVNESRGYS